MNAPAAVHDPEIEVLMRSLERWNAADIEGFLDCLTDDIYWDDPPMPSPATSKNEVRRWAVTARNAFPDMRFKFEQLFRGEDHTYAVKWTASATWLGKLDPPGFAPNGRHIEFPGVDVLRFRDGKICHIQTFFDSVKMAEKIGMIPKRPSPGSVAEQISVGLQRVVARFQRKG